MARRPRDKTTPKYVSRLKVKGYSYFRFRRGHVSAYFDGDLHSRDFVDWYESLLRGEREADTRELPAAGTFNALRTEYLSSRAYKTLAPLTQQNYRRIIDELAAVFGQYKVAAIKRRHIEKYLDGFADRPAAHDSHLKRLSTLLNFAIERDYTRVNEAKGIKRINRNEKEYRLWTDKEIAQFEARWPVGTKERLAHDLLLWTGQRSGDVRVMGHQHVQDGWLSVKQEKTKTRVDIPISENLAASIAAAGSENLTFLLTEQGKPFTRTGFYNFHAKAVKAAGLPSGRQKDGGRGLSPHGLRHAAATRLADLGCSNYEIMAITGHKSAREVERYTKNRDQKSLAQRAVLIMEAGTDREQILSNSVSNHRPSD